MDFLIWTTLLALLGKRDAEASSDAATPDEPMSMHLFVCGAMMFAVFFMLAAVGTL